MNPDDDIYQEWEVELAHAICLPFVSIGRAGPCPKCLDAARRVWAHEAAVRRVFATVSVLPPDDPVFDL